MSVHHLPWDLLQSNPFVSVYEICMAVRRRVKYTPEKKDVWQSAERTWESMRGDCEDMAVLVWTLARLNGFAAEIYVCFAASLGRVGHAIAGGTTPSGFNWISSNGSYEASEDSIWRMMAKNLGCPARDVHVLPVYEKTVQALLKTGVSETKEKRV